MLKFIQLFIFCSLFLDAISHDSPIVKTQNGLVRGSYRETKQGRKFAAFVGIPYAKAPVDELRFEPPKPHGPWLGIWEADTEYVCVQLIHDYANTNTVIGDEDCLYVNVYSPKINETENMDVIVHIHGGAFMFGSGAQYGPEILLDRDVVYVTFNYRLGPLGFLATEDATLPGNNGLKDQVLALRWIQENIAAFGGNKLSVTLTGLSAGGASVHYHYLSPMSRGLFTRGFSLSGTALSNWALVEQPRKKAQALGSAVGCEQHDVNDLVACLRQRPARQLAHGAKKLQPWLYNPYTPFGPVIEPPTSDSFLTENPYELIRTGRVANLPWITSVTSSEGLYPAANFLSSPNHLEYLDRNWERLAPYILHYNDTVFTEDQSTVAKKIREYYLADQPINEETFAQLVQAVGDRLFVVDAEKAARLQAKANTAPVYFYVFDYRGDHSISEYYAHSTDNYGVSHADDALYVITPDPIWFTKHLVSDTDKKLSELLVDMWISYVKTGKPKIKGAEWNAVSNIIEEPLKLLYIASLEDIAMIEVDDLGHKSFWDSLPIQENNNIFTNSFTSKDKFFIFLFFLFIVIHLKIL